MQVFVGADSVDDIQATIDAGLPERFRGWPVRYSLGDDDPAVHRVDVTTLGEWWVTSSARAWSLAGRSARSCGTHSCWSGARRPI